MSTGTHAVWQARADGSHAIQEDQGHQSGATYSASGPSNATQTQLTVGLLEGPVSIPLGHQSEHPRDWSPGGAALLPIHPRSHSDRPVGRAPRLAGTFTLFQVTFSGRPPATLTIPGGWPWGHALLVSPSQAQPSRGHDPTFREPIWHLPRVPNKPAGPRWVVLRSVPG